MYDRGVVKLFDKAVTSKRRKARTNHTVPPPALQPTDPLPNNSNISFRLPGLGPQRVEPCFNRSCLTFDSSQLNMPIHSISVLSHDHGQSARTHKRTAQRKHALAQTRVRCYLRCYFRRSSHNVYAPHTRHHGTRAATELHQADVARRK